MSERGPKPTERGVYVISVVADLSGMHPQTLRMYERRGLIEPKRTTGNSRRYSQQDVERLKRIQELTQEHGLNLAGVRIVMDLERKAERLQAKVEKLSRQLAETEQRLELEKRRRPRTGGVLVRMSDVAGLLEGLEKQRQT